MKACRDSWHLGRDSKRPLPDINLKYYHYANPLDVQRYQAKQKYTHVTSYFAVIRVITCRAVSVLSISNASFSCIRESLVVLSNYREECF
jgi:hypothetical protein